jgi:hypothetical protein
MAKQNNWFATDRLNCGEMIANVSGPAIEMSVIGIPVSTRIPSDDSPTSLSDHWCKDIECAREIKATMHHRNHRCIGIAPLI